MLLFFCPNPCLDVFYKVSSVKEDDTNRSDFFLTAPGGKGVNAARVANSFCRDVFLALPLGGCIGQCVRRLLEREGLSLFIADVREETRINSIVELGEEGKHFLIASRGHRLDEDSQEKLKTLICQECSPKVLVLGGSVPPGLSSSYYADIVKEYRDRDTKVIVDADGELLRKAVKEAPFAIKPNKYELERLVGHPLLTVEDVVSAAREIVRGGVKLVLVSLGEFGGVAVTERFAYRIIPPKVKVKSTVGAGDSVVGALAYAVYVELSLDEAVKFSIACGTAKVMKGSNELCSPADVKPILERTKLLPVET